jgi:hypothetical protein
MAPCERRAHLSVRSTHFAAVLSMTSRLRPIAVALCALALVACCRTLAAQPGHTAADSAALPEPVPFTGWDNHVGDESAGALSSQFAQAQYIEQPMPMDGAWIAPSPAPGSYVEPGVAIDGPLWAGGGMTQPLLDPSQGWFWQVLPDGLIYHSYWAGVHEPRLGIVAMSEEGSQSFWDGALGGRVGLLRYGDAARIFPQGWQLDVEAAAIIRMTLDQIRDFEFADYRVGVPVTYGIENWQFKFAGYHLSSHLGDEFAIANPGSLADRINYVRDALVFGASVYPVPLMRLYAEAAYAFNVDGGAEPWEFQFGSEISRPGPTGLHGTPYFAINGHLREELGYGGDVSTNAGWLWRGQSGQVVRAGVHYFNGKSSQYQIFDEHEQQIGFGLWYDY